MDYYMFIGNAVEAGYQSLVREHLNTLKRDNCNVNDYCGSSLYTAADKGDVGMVELLLEYGADVNVTDWIGKTPLMSASDGGLIDVMRVLLRYQADVNKTGGLGWSALRYAAMCNRVQAVELLLQRGAHVNLASWRGFTALHYSAEGGHTESALMLLKYGADVTLGNENGKTALMIAESIGHTTTAEAIKGYKPNKTPFNADQTLSQDALENPSIAGLPNGYTPVGGTVLANSDKSQLMLAQQILPENRNQAPAVAYYPYKRVDDPNLVHVIHNAVLIQGGYCSYSAPTEGRPTELELSNLAGKIGYEWIQLALEFGIPYSVTQQIKMEIPHDSRQQILHMLMRWRGSVQDKDEEDRCCILRRALTNHGRMDLANTV